MCVDTHSWMHSMGMTSCCCVLDLFGSCFAVLLCTASEVQAKDFWTEPVTPSFRSQFNGIMLTVRWARCHWIGSQFDWLSASATRAAPILVWIFVVTLSRFPLIQLHWTYTSPLVSCTVCLSTSNVTRWRHLNVPQRYIFSPAKTCHTFNQQKSASLWWRTPISVGVSSTYWKLKTM